VGERLSLDLEHEEVDTLGGLVLALLERPPKKGDVVTHGGLRIEVSEIDGHAVKTCLISRQTQDPELNGSSKQV
jgi:CBS domain containing-hemolysin-like protein